MPDIIICDLCDSICQRAGSILSPIHRIEHKREPQLPLMANHALSAILVSTTLHISIPSHQQSYIHHLQTPKRVALSPFFLLEVYPTHLAELMLSVLGVICFNSYNDQIPREIPF